MTRRAAVLALERLDRPPHIHAASWEVPLHCFVAFDLRERHLMAHPKGSGPQLTYLTTTAAALDRLDRVIGVVETTLQDADGIVGLLSDLVDRLAHFHDGLLEPDYGGLAELIPAPDLVTDTTCQELGPPSTPCTAAMRRWPRPGTRPRTAAGSTCAAASPSTDRAVGVTRWSGP